MRFLRSAIVSLAVVILAACWTMGLSGQVPAQLPMEPILDSGASVTGAFEGWYKNNDGSYSILVGYLNRNQKQTLDLAVGPDNHIDPGGPDQGQPTHFYPRRNMFLFTIRVPKDFGDKELVWTVVTHGKTERAFASLKADYLLNKQTIGTEVGANMSGLGDELLANAFPVLSVEGDRRRSARVGQPLALVARVTDDGIPSGARQTRAPARGTSAGR